MKPEDVGLTPTMPYFRPNTGPENLSPPPITYLHLYQCEQFSVISLHCTLVLFVSCGISNHDLGFYGRLGFSVYRLPV